MSLKPKLEAVIYAAEEPVTMVQLAGIFSKEILDELAAESVPGDQPETGESVSADQLPIVEIGDTAPDPEAVSTENGAAVPEPEEAAGMDEKKAARLRERKVREVLQQALDELIADYANGQRGMEIREIAGGYRMATKPEYHDVVRGLVKSLKPPMRLSLQALETLAVIAYKQPVTAPEVSEIRGVDSGGVLGSLMARKLITTAGRKHVIGRPILYKTTKDFLLRFGLKDLSELPSIEEFEKMAGELAEAEGETEIAATSSSEETAAGEKAASGGEESEQVVPADEESPADEGDGQFSSVEGNENRE